MKLELIKIEYADNGDKREIYSLGKYIVYRDIYEKPFRDYIYIRVCDTDNFIPDIVKDETPFWRDCEYERKFKIQTTAYGTMDKFDIQKVITGYEYAIEAVDILNESFGIGIDK